MALEIHIHVKMCGGKALTKQVEKMDVYMYPAQHLFLAVCSKWTGSHSVSDIQYMPACNVPVYLL